MVQHSVTVNTYAKKKIKRDLLSLTCRHQVLECIIGKVFDVLISVSNGPNIQTFQRLSDNCIKINKNKYECEIIEDKVVKKLKPQK